MADRIENKLKEIAKLNSKILADIEKRLDAAGLKAAESAARWSSKLLNNVSNDPAINKMLGKIGAWGGKGGAAAANSFTKEFKKGVRDTTGSLNKLSGMMADVDRRMKSLSERKTAGWSKAAAVQREIMQAQKAVNEQIALNKRLMKTITYQAGQTQDSAEQKALLAKRKQLHLINEELQKSVDLSEKLGVQTRQVEVEEWIQGRLEKSFGWIGKMQDGGNKGMDIASHLMKNKKLGLATAGALMFELLKVMVGEIVVAGKVFRETGQTASQLKKSVSSTGEVTRDMLSRGLILPTEEAAKVVSGLQSNLGELHVPRELNAQAGEMVSLFKMSSDEAAKFSATLYRFAGRDSKAVTKTLQYVEAYSQKNGVNGAELMRTMSEHAEDFAKAGNMSAEAFARAAADSQRIGYNMSSMTHLADRLVDDFEGALKSQAELSTMFPGMDLSETIYASQFGTQEQVADSVKEMINGSGYDINNLPRSFKNNLQKNLGLSASEIANIAGSKDISKFASVDQQDQMAMSERVLTKVFDGSTGGLAEIIKLLKSIAFAVNPFSSMLNSWSDRTRSPEEEAARAQPIGNSYKKGQEVLTYASAHMGKFHTGGIVGEPIPRFHTGLLNNEMLAVLQKGEAVLTEEMQHGVTALAGSSNNGTDTTRVEALLSELISAVKNSETVIEMDAQKVGKAITKSFSRS